ncbi:Os06g0139400, partial [Oryza sativa Japonica Group]
RRQQWARAEAGARSSTAPAADGGQSGGGRCLLQPHPQPPPSLPVASLPAVAVRRPASGGDPGVALERRLRRAGEGRSSGGGRDRDRRGGWPSEGRKRATRTAASSPSSASPPSALPPHYPPMRSTPPLPATTHPPLPLSRRAHERVRAACVSRRHPLEDGGIRWWLLLHLQRRR